MNIPHQFVMYGDSIFFSYIYRARFKGKPQINAKPRNTLAALHLDRMHLCITENCNTHTCIKTEKQLNLLLWTSAYRPNGRLQGCSSVFPFFEVFRWTSLIYKYLTLRWIQRSSFVIFFPFTYLIEIMFMYASTRVFVWSFSGI